MRVPAPSLASQRPVRVMIADDSAVARGLFARWAAEDPALDHVGSARNGAHAVELAAALDPDVLVLDIEMPVLNGLEALPQLLATCPNLRVVMASTLTEKGAAVTLRALELGAADYVAKPVAGEAEGYRETLLEKVKALGAGAAQRRAGQVAPAPRVPLRGFPAVQPRLEALVVGASTGGPEALRRFFQALGPGFPGPIVLAQHMPPVFTRQLAEQLSRTCPPAVEAEDGMPLQPGRIHVAPGDHHLTVRRDGAAFVAGLDQAAPENFCRPAVDPLFRSAAAVFGSAACGVVLTGMGQDGRAGAQALVEAGGVVLAQDEASSVVWGMPGAVARAGLAAMVAEAPALGRAVRALAEGRRP